MVGGFAVVGLFSLFTPAMEKETIENIFECYDRPTTVKITKVLVDEDAED